MRVTAALALAALALFAAPFALAEDHATTKDAELLVHQAVAFLKKEGKGKAFETFSDPKGRFTYRDLYVMAYDLSGKCLAHGAKKERVGKNFMEEKDVDGKQFMKERFRIAKDHGKGWQDYKYENPVTKKTEQKTAYFERVGDVVVVSGAYKNK
ncbi:MAG TPA: cache domain-containing protein [Anaeromyxobacter sp.]